MNSKRLLINSKNQEIYSKLKSYRDVEFKIKYYESLSDNEDVEKLKEIVKNDNIRQDSLFIFIYKLILPIWRTDIYSMKSKNN